MRIAELPFNKLIGLRVSASDEVMLVNLPDNQQYTNHLGTVHGSALLAVAEAGSGEFLLRKFGKYSGFIPVVRKIEAKFKKPASGQVSARCDISQEVIDEWLEQLNSRGRLSASIPIEVVDSNRVVVLSATVEWFITKGETNA